MTSPLTDDRSSGRPSFFSAVLSSLTAGRLWRLVMAFLMASTFVIGSWSMLVAYAQAATPTQNTTVYSPIATTPAPARGKPHQKPITNATPKTLSVKQPLMGWAICPSLPMSPTALTTASR